MRGCAKGTYVPSQRKEWHHIVAFEIPRTGIGEAYNRRAIGKKQVKDPSSFTGPDTPHVYIYWRHNLSRTIFNPPWREQTTYSLTCFLELIIPASDIKFRRSINETRWKWVYRYFTSDVLQFRPACKFRGKRKKNKVLPSCRHTIVILNFMLELFDRL